MRRTLITFVALVSAVALSVPLWARQVQLKLHNGQLITGDAEEPLGEENVVVNSRGIQVTIPRADIAHVQWIDDLETEYLRRESAYSSTDIPGRIGVARWGFGQGLYLHAEQTLSRLLTDVDPDNVEAKDMLDIVRRQIEMEQRQTTRPVRPPAATRPQGEEPEETRNVLTADQINLIRQYEATDADGEGMRIRFDNDVIARFLESSNLSHRDFRRLNNYEKFRLIEQKGDPSLLKDIRILTDPRVLSEFRQRVQPVLLSGCLLSGCHSASGPTAQSFGLVRGTRIDDEAAYTNFYTLQFYTRSVQSVHPGMFVPPVEELRMIDRVRPGQSLILQYGLPRHMADNPHPDVTNFRPIYGSPQDQRSREIRRWIQRLPLGEPDYGFNAMPATTQPAVVEPQP